MIRGCGGGGGSMVMHCCLSEESFQHMRGKEKKIYYHLVSNSPSSSNTFDRSESTGYFKRTLFCCVKH